MNREMIKMTWPEFQDAISTKPVILPAGSLEQHGFHLPLNVDVITTHNLSLLLAEAIDGIVAPPINYGYKSKPSSGGGPLFPGTIDLDGNTLVHLVYDILAELARDGVKYVFIVNGHYENEAFLAEAMDFVTKDFDITVVMASWWDLVPQKVVDLVFGDLPFPGWDLEHAALTETCMVMHFEPELVHMERYVEEPTFERIPYHVYPVEPGLVPASGPLATARTASAEKGKRMADAVIQEYVKIYNNTKEWRNEECMY